MDFKYDVIVIGAGGCCSGSKFRLKNLSYHYGYEQGGANEL